MTFVLLGALVAEDLPPEAGAESYVYKKTPQADMELYVLKPKDAAGPRPAILFFFPGGWRLGKVRNFLPQAEAMVKDGWIAILADYRVADRHKTEPRDAVEDALDAYAWLRQNAGMLGIEPSKVVVAGGSSGGHLAACVGLFELQNGKLTPRTEDFPVALVLFNPVLDVVKYAGDRPGKIIVSDPPAISPMHQLNKGLPATLILHGTADTTVPVEKTEEFARKAKEFGCDVTVIKYPGKVHGFYGPQKDEEGFALSLRDMKDFLGQKKISP